MTKLEKVIKGLECCEGYCDDETGCPYSDEFEPFDCQKQLRADAIALLEAQMPVEPKYPTFYDWIESVMGDDQKSIVDDHDFVNWMVTTRIPAHIAEKLGIKPKEG